MIRMEHSGPLEEISRRQLLGRRCSQFFHDALADTPPGKTGEEWTLTLGPSLLFDSSGLRLLQETLQSYRGGASELQFRLKLDPAAHRDYYSLGSDLGADSSIALPVEARRNAGGGRDTLFVELPYSAALPAFPRSLADRVEVMTPLALLMEYQGDVDFLFANQIALFSRLAREVPWSPQT